LAFVPGKNGSRIKSGMTGFITGWQALSRDDGLYHGMTGFITGWQGFITGWQGFITGWQGFITGWQGLLAKDGMNRSCEANDKTSFRA